MSGSAERDQGIISQAPETIRGILHELEDVPSSGIPAEEALHQVGEIVVETLAEKDDPEVWKIIKELGDWIFSPDLQEVSDGLRGWSIAYFAGAHNYLVKRWVKPPQEVK